MGEVVPILTTLGQRVREARQGWGTSLDQVAADAGLSKSQVWNIENDKSDPRLSTIVKLADALKVGVSYLAHGTRDDGYHKGYQDALDAVRKLRPPLGA